MNTLSIAALALAALAATAGPAQAVTNSPRNPAEPKVLMQHTQKGVVEKIGGSGVTVEGKTYFVSGQTRVFDHAGNPGSTARLAVGRAIQFTLTQDGSQQRIKELWILE